MKKKKEIKFWNSTIEELAKLRKPVVRQSTPISDKANVSIDSEGNEDLGTWIYELGLLLDKKIPLKGLTNAQRIEIAVREYCA